VFIVSCILFVFTSRVLSIYVNTAVTVPVAYCSWSLARQHASWQHSGRRPMHCQFRLLCNSSIVMHTLPSVLQHCWLGGRKGIRPVKTEWWGVGMVVCLEWGADLHMTQLMPLLLTVPCFSKIQIGLPFWYRLTHVVQEKRAIKRVCVCVNMMGVQHVKICSSFLKCFLWELWQMQHILE